MARNLQTKEGSDGRTYSKCPNCSKLYGWRSDDGKVVEDDIPNTCKRCGAPMDFEKAKAFADEQAREQHVPILAEIGNRLRAVPHAPVDRMVKAAANK